MKTIFTLVFAIAFSFFASAQSSVITIDYNKLPTTAISYNFESPKNIVEAAIQSKMSAYNVKAKKKNGYLVYYGVTIPEISSTPIDVYFKTVQTGKKNSPTSTVTMLMSGGSEVFYSNEADAEKINSGVLYLENFKTDISAEQLKADISAQSALVKSTEKSMSKKENELKKLNKQKKDIENKISKLEKEIADSQLHLQTQKDKREQLQAQ